MTTSLERSPVGRAGLDRTVERILAFEREHGRPPTDPELAGLVGPPPIKARRPERSTRDALVRVGALLSAALLLFGVWAGWEQWPRYSDGGLPGRPTTYADGHYTFLMTQPNFPDEPVGFNPCRQIGVEINYANATPTIRPDVERVLRTVNRVSGLHLVVVGATNRVRQDPYDGNILVSFADSRTDPLMTEDVAGRGGGWSFQQPLPGQHIYFQGATVTLQDRNFNSTFHAAQLQILAHEFGHAVGLNHASGREMMNAESISVSHYQHGDLTGLAKLGMIPCQ